MSKMHTATVTAGSGRFRLEAVLTVTPRGITVTACSPDHAHLGATAQAIPRPEPGRTATVSILAVPCHRDEIPAHDIAAALATRFKMPAAVSTGFHVDSATDADIQTFMETTNELIDALIAHVEQIRRATWEDDEEVVAVTKDGVETGTLSRDSAHTGLGILHQAFMVFLVEGAGEDAHLLLCRRSTAKRLWGGVLADSCSGHPRPGEGIETTAVRRLTEETGLAAADVSLKAAGHIVYREDHGDGHAEHEWCAALVGRIRSGASLDVNSEEVSELRRIRLTEVDASLQGVPEPLAPWTAAALRDPGIRAAIESVACEAV